MNRQDFNAMVELAMRDDQLSAMRPVVEKELLHHEIFQALDDAGLLKHLVFQGGTSLRLCRGSDRFSEDLDFAGGRDFTADKMQGIEECIEKHIGLRFGLNVTVKEPKEPKGREAGRSGIALDRWWISIETAPENAAMPRQKIKLEIANIPAYQVELVPLRQNYEFLGGMKEILVNVESVSEILADKIVAFPTSLVDNQGAPLPPTAAKIRYRDLWDIAWLLKKRAELDPRMVASKIRDYGIPNFPELLDRAIEMIPAVVKSAAFQDQMRRFIDAGTVKRTLGDERYLDYLASTVGGQFQEAKAHLQHAAALEAAKAVAAPGQVAQPKKSASPASSAD